MTTHAKRETWGLLSAYRDGRGKSKLRPGSGRLAGRDTASTEMMKYLTGQLGLPVETAAHITADANRWFWGRSIPWSTVRTHWVRLS